MTDQPAEWRDIADDTRALIATGDTPDRATLDLMVAELDRLNGAVGVLLAHEWRRMAAELDEQYAPDRILHEAGTATADVRRGAELVLGQIRRRADRLWPPTT